MWSDWSYCSTAATFNYLTRLIIESRSYHMTSYSYVLIPGSQRGRDKPTFHSVSFQNNNTTMTPTHGSSGSELRVGSSKSPLNCLAQILIFLLFNSFHLLLSSDEKRPFPTGKRWATCTARDLICINRIVSADWTSTKHEKMKWECCAHLWLHGAFCIQLVDARLMWLCGTATSQLFFGKE